MAPSVGGYAEEDEAQDWRALIVALTLLFVSSGARPPSAEALQDAPLSGCTQTVHVYIFVDGYYPNPGTVSPSPGPCWDYHRVVQNTSTFTICHYNLSYRGQGSSGWFDDTNPVNDLGQEVTAIEDCSIDDGTFGSLLAEDMAARDTPQDAWCQDNGYSQPCWRIDTDIVGVTNQFAELYSSASAVEDLNNHWLSGGYGASISTPTWPMINIGPLSGDNSQLQFDIDPLCSAENTGGYVGIDAGTAYPLQLSDFQEINRIFNGCTG